MEAVAAGLVPHLQESSEPILTSQHAPDHGHGPTMSPLLQVCLWYSCSGQVCHDGCVMTGV